MAAVVAFPTNKAQAAKPRRVQRVMTTAEQVAVDDLLILLREYPAAAELLMQLVHDTIYGYDGGAS